MNKQSSEPDKADNCNILFDNIVFSRSLNDAAELVTQHAGRLSLKSPAKRDYFNDPDGKLSNSNAPVLLTQIDNTKAFTLTATVTPAFTAKYDAGALYVFSSNEHWQKFAFEQDERGRHRIVSVRTIGTSDDNNHDTITSDTVQLKISSDTRTIAFYYATDGTSWNLARLYKNDYPDTIWLGLSAQCPFGEGTSVIFENLSLIFESVKDFRLGI